MTMSSPAGPVLVLLALGTVAATWGLDDACVPEAPWPEPLPILDHEAGNLALLRALADLEEAHPGAGRARALDLARRRLSERAGDEPAFTIEEGTVPVWGEGTVLDFGGGGGHQGYSMTVCRLARDGAGATATAAMAFEDRWIGKPVRVACRTFPATAGEYRAVLRLVEALSAFRILPRKEYAGAWTSTTSFWTAATATAPSGVLFREAFGVDFEGSDDHRVSVRSSIAGHLAYLLLLHGKGEPRTFASRDREWLRAVYGLGEAEPAGLLKCWGALFAAVGDSEYRRRTEYVQGR